MPRGKRGCSIIGWRLRRARKAAGLSLRALGSKVGLTHAAIKRYEGEDIRPSQKVISALAQALDVECDYFFSAQAILLQAIKYRESTGLSRKQLEVIQWQAIEQIEKRMGLENLFPFPVATHFSLPSNLPKKIHDLAAIETFVALLRQAWGLGCSPALSLIDLLEMQGIYVLVTSVDKASYKKFNGLTAWIGQTPIIAVDKNWPGDRQRFTLAHELGHIFLSNRLDKALDEELACHYFAGAFLLPEEVAKRHLGLCRKHFTVGELALIKEKFGLSMIATLYRAYDLGILQPYWFTRQLRQFRKNGWHLKEPGDAYPAEQSRMLERLVFRALGENYIDTKKAQVILRTPLGLLQQDFGFKGVTL